MSDSQRRYHAVKTKMSQLLPDQWADCPTRLANLSLLVSSIVKAKDLTQHALAAEMPVTAQDTSLAQRQRRWLMNEQVTAETYYEPIIRPVLQSLSQATIPLILDTTAVGANCHLLSVAVGYQRRALPVAWQAGKGKRGHTKGETQIELLERTQPLLPDQADVIVLGDGEFGHVTLLRWLQTQGYDDCLRVARDTLVEYEGQWQRLDSFDLQPDETIWLEQVHLTQQDAFGPVNRLLVFDPRHNCAVPIVTNLALPQAARRWYCKRPWTEPLFGDLKGHGFDFQTSRLRHPDRLDRFMIAIALAYLWLCFLGSVALMTGLAKLVDRSDHRQRSLFTIGRQWLNRLLKLDKPFLVSFHPYPFLHLSKVGVG
jgi:hypothetical protein